MSKEIGIEDDDIVIARDKRTGEKYYVVGRPVERIDWSYAHASAKDVAVYNEGLCKEDIIDAIANKTYEFSGNHTVNYDTGIRAWCNVNGLEIIGVLGK